MTSANINRTVTSVRRGEGPVTGISVREALELPSLASARLIAGEAGLDRRIRSVNMMEVPDIEPWLREDELLVTTAYPLRESGRSLVDLVRLLTERGLAGLAVKPGRYLLEIPPEALALADQLALPVLQLTADASFNDILGGVLGTILNRQAIQLERARSLHDRLNAVVLAGGGLQEVIEALSRLTRSDAAITDARGAYLASSSDRRDEAREGWTRATRPIQAGGVHHGAVIVWAPDTHIPRDTLVAMDHAATIAALTLTHAQAVAGREQRTRVRLLEELVSGRPLEREETVALGRSFGWDLERPRTALLVELQTEAGDESAVADHPLEERLLRLVHDVMPRGTIAWALRSGLAVLAPGAAEPAARELRAAIRARHPGLTVAVGVGSRRRDPLELHHSYREAIETLALGRMLRGPDFALSHAELGVYRLLGELPAERLEALCADVLGPLLEAGGPLVDTLDAYLAHGRNRAATARALFVHYNTLRHRLEQIERLLDIGERGGEGWLQADLALHARRLLIARGLIVGGQQASARPSIRTRPEERPNRRNGSGSPRSNSA